MAAPFDGLTPALLWKHFEALTRIPRCSGNEAGAAQHVLEWASSKGFVAEKDATGNVVVRVSASAGLDHKPPVVLQGHLDMVGEKDSSSPHDFAKDPIQVRRDGDYLTGTGTTLGADNAVGLAAAMAVAEDPLAVHGPLELVMTVDEETGLTGAQALTPDAVTGRTMLNLDSEEEGSLYVGCAGGADTLITLPVKRKAAEGLGRRVVVAGLKGGHSGLDINLGRGNALRLLGWFLHRLRQASNIALVELSGGDKHNAIPREASAHFLLPKRGGKKALDELLSAFRADLRAMFGKTDPGVTIEVTEAGPDSAEALAPRSRDEVLHLMLALPHGLLGMSQAVAGLVETSTNLAVVRLEKEHALFHESSRSSVMPHLAAVQDGLFAAAALVGADATNKGGYPGWQPNLDSAVLARAKAVHQRLFGKVPEVKAIHAGLECGIIGEKFGGMDMISFGPQIEWPHSPSERVKIDTVGRFYDLLRALLDDLSA